MNEDLYTLSKSIQSKEISPVEVVQQLLNRIAELNPHLNAFITITETEALESAGRAEKEILAGDWKGPLHGVPIGLKDLIYTKGIRTTMGSEIYRDYIPDFSATVAERLEAAGAVLIGKLNTHQFAYGPTGDISYFGPARNPYNLKKITGGSSSGSGAAVSAGLCYGALGTDTGGSVRIPSACCGIVGMKPTFGRVSKYGVYPLGYTLDHVGPMTRTVRDNALMLNALAGYDPNDPYSANREGEDFTASIGEGVCGTVIGVPANFFYDDLHEEVRKSVRQAIETLRRLGAQIREIHIPYLQEVTWAQLITIRSEAYAVHEEHLQHQADLLHPDVRQRILSAEDKAYEYVKALQIRLQASEAFRSVFQEVDAFIVPTLPILPPDIGQQEVVLNGKSENVRAQLLRFNGPMNSTGFPSLSMPSGFSESGLPISAQLVGGKFEERKLYRIGFELEKALGLATLKREIGV